MTLELPQVGISRFCPVSPELVLRAYLSCQPQGISLNALQRNLQTIVSPAAVDDTVALLIERGEVLSDKTLKLANRKAVSTEILGRDAGTKWADIKARRLPLIVLGYDPDDFEVRRKFSKPDQIKAAVIAVGFGLPKEIAADLKAVRSEIVWRILRAGLADIVGRGPFPMIEKPGTVERTLLSGMIGVASKSIVDATNNLAAHAVGIKKGNLDAVKERLIVLGIERCQSNGAAIPLNRHVDNFAAKVAEIASKLSTPPFHGRVAIAQVYDQYGKIYPDAGSLAAFKERLVGAAKNREIQLGRLDLPERMANDLRERSETKWNREEVHFVITDWK